MVINNIVTIMDVLRTNSNIYIIMWREIKFIFFVITTDNHKKVIF